MGNLEAGQIVRALEDFTGYGYTDPYSKGDLLEVLRMGNGGWYVCKNILSGKENTRVYPKEVCVLEKFEVTITKEIRVNLGVDGRMHLLNVGDTISVVLDEGAYYYLGGPDVGPVYIRESEFTKVDESKDAVLPKEVDYADIRKGDLIKSSYTENGVLKERTGRADRYSTYGWNANEGDYVALKSWSRSGVVYLLLDRGENIFETAAVGSLAIRKYYETVYYKVGDNKWSLVQVTQGRTHPVTFTNDQVQEWTPDLLTPPSV